MKTKNVNLERLVKFYESRYEEFGNDVKSVGWGDAKSQRLRFRILSEIAHLSGCQICDLGCGFGDLYLYLDNKFNSVDYYGIDICEKFIQEAKRRYPQLPFEVRNILQDPPKEKFDYVLSSGALSFKFDDHESYIREMLKAMMGMSSKGVAVNFLSSYVDYELDKNFHFSPLKALEMGKSLTPHVTIRHDYPLYEFTMYLYHNADY